MMTTVRARPRYHHRPLVVLSMVVLLTSPSSWWGGGVAEAGLLVEYGNPDGCLGAEAASYMLDTDCFQGFSTSNYHRITCTGSRGEAINSVWPPSRHGCIGEPVQVELYVPGCNTHKGVIAENHVYNYSATLGGCPSRGSKGGRRRTRNLLRDGSSGVGMA